MLKAERVVGRFLTAATVRLPDNAEDAAELLIEACDSSGHRRTPSYWDVIEEMEKHFQGSDALYDPCGSLFNVIDAIINAEDDAPEERARAKRLEDQIKRMVKDLYRQKPLR